MNEEINSELIIRRINNLLNYYQSKGINVTLYKICKNANMNPSTLNNIMSGKFKDIRFSTLCKIAKGFQMSLREFFDDNLFS